MADALGCDAGGIASLYRLLSEHGEALEADLQETYGVALSGLCTGALTWRRLGVLVRQLPRTARITRALAPEPAVVDWGVTEHLLAAVFDALNVANWQRVAASTKHPPRAPRPLPRPGDKRSAGRIGRTTRSPAEVKAWLASFNPAPAPPLAPPHAPVTDPEAAHG